MADESSQVYPPWLTLVTSTVTDAFGDPITTATSVAYLPLTYYGPSIPLGPDWTWGGLTSPASTTFVPPTSAPSSSLTNPPTTLSISSALPTTSTTAIPSSSTTIPTSTTLTTSAISSLTTSPSSSSQISSSTSLSSSAPANSSSSSSGAGATSATRSSSSKHLSNSLIGAIVGAVGGFVLLCFLLLLLALWRRGYKRRHNVSWEVVQQDDDEDPTIPHPYTYSAAAATGEGSPNMAEAETDPFLQRSHHSRSGSGSHSGASGSGASGGVRLISSGGSGNGSGGFGAALAGGGAAAAAGIGILNSDQPRARQNSGDRDVASYTTSMIARQYSAHDATNESGSFSSLFYNPTRATPLGAGHEATDADTSNLSLSQTAHTTGGDTATATLHDPNDAQFFDSLPMLPPGAAPPRIVGGPILSREQLLRMHEAPTSPDSPLYNPERDAALDVLSSSQQQRNSLLLTPLTAPPVSPERRAVVRRLRSSEGSPSSSAGNDTADSASFEDARRAKLMATTRVRISDARVRQDPDDPRPPPPIRIISDAAKDSIALLRRLSPFRRTDDASTHDPQSDSLAGARLNQLPLQTPEYVDTPNYLLMPPPSFRSREMGYVAGGDRPVSGVSSQSVGSTGASTVYHSAVSTQSSKSTGKSNGSGGSVPPLPSPGALPASANMRIHGPSHLQTAIRVESEPSGSEAAPIQISGGSAALGLVREGSEGSQAPSPYDHADDPLDVPAPAPVSQFSSASSRGSGLEVPPGLPLPSTWAKDKVATALASADDRSAMTLVSSETSADIAISTPYVSSTLGNTSHSAGQVLSSDPADVPVLVEEDVTNALDDEPPVAGSQWQSLARLHETEVESRRLTLGQPMVLNPVDVRSENSSLQSYLHPHSRSGSQSHFQNSSGSHSRSHGTTSSSDSQPHSYASGPSLVHSNSIGSDGRWRPRRLTHSPPPPSASGSVSPRFQRASLTATGPQSRLFTPSPPLLAPAPFVRAYSPGDKVEISNEERLRVAHERAVENAGRYS